LSVLGVTPVILFDKKVKYVKKVKNDWPRRKVITATFLSVIAE